MRYALWGVIDRNSLLMIYSFHALTASAQSLQLLTLQCTENPKIMEILSRDTADNISIAHHSITPTPTIRPGEPERVQLQFDQRIYARNLSYDVLFLAARRGCIPLVYYLIAHNLGNISDALLGAALGGQIPLMCNIMHQKGSAEIAQKSLWKAILYQQTALLSLCMRYDIDIEMRNGYGFTPLMLAASVAGVDVISDLYARGASLPTGKQLRRLTPRAKWYITTNQAVVKQRAKIIQQCLEQKGLPQDLTRLLWELAGLPSQYKPEGVWGTTPVPS